MGVLSKNKNSITGKSGYESLETIFNPDIPSPKALVDSLKAKAKWFQDFEEAAKKQASAYEKAWMEVEKSMADDYRAEINKNNIPIPTTGIEVVLGEDISKARLFSRDEWRSRETALLSHIHAIAERYRQELSSMAICMNRSLNELEKVNTTAAILLYRLGTHEVTSTGLDAWVLSRINPEMHCCQSMTCVSQSESTFNNVGEPARVIDILRRERKETESTISQARNNLRQNISQLRENDPGHRQYVEWEIKKLAPSPDLSMVAQSMPRHVVEKETELLKKWELWFEERTRSVIAKHEAHQKEVREKRSRLEWARKTDSPSLVIKKQK